MGGEDETGHTKGTLRSLTGSFKVRHFPTMANGSDTDSEADNGFRVKIEVDEGEATEWYAWGMLCRL